jgi:hypothetical protein
MAVRQMLTECDRGGFEVLDSYFNNDDGTHGQRVAAKELSKRLGRHVSVGEYNQALTDVRLGLIAWLSGGVKLPAEALGRWPDARNLAWREDSAEIAELLDDVRQQRKLRAV